MGRHKRPQSLGSTERGDQQLCVVQNHAVGSSEETAIVPEEEMSCLGPHRPSQLQGEELLPSPRESTTLSSSSLPPESPRVWKMEGSRPSLGPRHRKVNRYFNHPRKQCQRPPGYLRNSSLHASQAMQGALVYPSRVSAGPEVPSRFGC
jgi:hypothetical protein